jgi:hypothetical protein
MKGIIMETKQLKKPSRNIDFMHVCLYSGEGCSEGGGCSLGGGCGDYGSNCTYGNNCKIGDNC